MRKLIVAALFGLPLLVVTAALAQDDEEMNEDEAFPQFLAVQFRADGNADSKEMDRRYLDKLRVEYAEKDVLFLTVNLSTRATQYQARLFVNYMDLGDLWRAYSRKPGNLVLVDVALGRVLHTLTARDDLESARAAIEKFLNAAEDEDVEEGEEEEDSPMPEDEER